MAPILLTVATERDKNRLMSKADAAVPADKLALYEKLVATLPGVDRKGAGMPYTSVNGHMFSYLDKTGKLGLRLPAEAREEFIAKYRTKLCEQHGIVQKEYVEVPDALLKKTSELGPHFALSHAHVSSLKPKPTTRAKASAQPAPKTSAKPASKVSAKPASKVSAKPESKATKKPGTTAKGVSFDTVRELGLAMPHVEEGLSYGTPALKVGKKMFARLKEDGETLVLNVGHDAKELLLQGDPDVFYTTDHYNGYPIVLVRLGEVKKAFLKKLLEDAYRFSAPAKLAGALG